MRDNEMLTSLGRRLLRAIAAIVVYAVAAWVAGALTLPANVATSLRPPNALLLALALLDKPGRRWLYVLATIPGNPTLYDARASWLVFGGYAVANAVEVAVGLALVQRFIGRT